MCPVTGIGRAPWEYADGNGGACYFCSRVYRHKYSHKQCREDVKSDMKDKVKHDLFHSHRQALIERKKQVRQASSAPLLGGRSGVSSVATGTPSV